LDGVNTSFGGLSARWGDDLAEEFTSEQIAEAHRLVVETEPGIVKVTVTRGETDWREQGD